jgi:3-oxoacyl-[acyl-carrier protein] reductase
MELYLKGKKALVTGGSHGIGQSIVIALANEGCDIAYLSRSKQRLSDTTALLQNFSVKKLALQADVLLPADIHRAQHAISNEWGDIDILINNVGGGGRWGDEDILKTPKATWDEVFQKNAGVTQDFTLWAIPQMLRQKWGRVITITSIYGIVGGGRPWFNIAKTAQTAFMKNLALNKSLVRNGITFNSVAPGSIMIPNTGWEDTAKRDPSGFKNLLDEHFPLNRLGKPEEVADVVTFLCSPRSALINGSSILIDGGETSSF